MNIIKLHKSITLNVFAILGFIVGIPVSFSNFSERLVSVIILTCALIGLLIEYIAKKYNYEKAFNLCLNFKNKWIKSLYFIAFYIGIGISFLTIDSIIIGFIILSNISKNYLRRSYVANFFAPIGILLSIINICLTSGDLSGDKGDGVAWAIILFLAPASIIFTTLLIIAMIIERLIKKSPNYGNLFLNIPVALHLVCLYTGLIGGSYFAIFIIFTMILAFLVINI